MSEEKPEYDPTTRMTLNEHGIAIPEEAVKECQHQDVLERYSKVAAQAIQYVCQDCKRKVMVKILNAAIMLPEQLVEFEKEMAARQAASLSAMRRRKVGLVLPGEVQQ